MRVCPMRPPENTIPFEAGGDVSSLFDQILAVCGFVPRQVKSCVGSQLVAPTRCCQFGIHPFGLGLVDSFLIGSLGMFEWNLDGGVPSISLLCCNQRAKRGCWNTKWLHGHLFLSFVNHRLPKSSDDGCKGLLFFGRIVNRLH